MGKQTLRGKDLVKLGFEPNRAIGISLNVMQKYYKYSNKKEKLDILKKVLATPQHFAQHEFLKKIAQELLPKKKTADDVRALRDKALPYKIYGMEGIEHGAMNQMYQAMKLPITVAGALMPDAHQGYGLPIGGVLATKNTVIPYGVGVDIGCRMCLSVYDIPTSYLKGHVDKLKGLLLKYTRFGMGSKFDNPIDDAIFERDEFKLIPMVKSLKDKAASQIGSSGGGNHFVEFGIVHIPKTDKQLNLEAGDYFAILSHSGSRGLGANIAKHYTNLAKKTCKLPKGVGHLAWLDLNSEAGHEYWLAMNLAGDYASACHHQIHKRLGKALGEKPLAMVENHHNFAWKEKLSNGEEVIVHRKGATPASKDTLGIIPGSMTAAGFIVRGKGDAASLNSASHGAGRQMSRSKAKQSLTQSEVTKYLKQKGVSLIGGGLDEAPMAYKNIDEVMLAQQDLVEIVGTFLPKIVRMAGD
ncbi:MAG: RtcB family protein [Chitinophagales bacterium]